jgi:hypothetical protein
LKRLLQKPTRPLPPLARDLLVVFAFLALTTLMTWPWVTRMRDAVSDRGDPYMIAWTLWWDYHQTFTDPLHLFHANVFHPFKYSLAFSENDYGIALLFFPLFALGLHPLTVQSVATFVGFAFCGYGAFRLARTLTGSNAAAWVAGIVFAFVPFRFHLLSHLHYLFAGWVPLLLESLVLFARERTWKRAAWLGVAFLMNALTCITWFVLTLAPLALTAAYLVVRHRLARERDFWLRGATALGLATLALLPFFLPYHYASKLYGFAWTREEVTKNSPDASAWLVGERRNKLWEGFGGGYSRGYPLFPGLFTLLLSFAAFRVRAPRERKDETGADGDHARTDLWAARLDALAVGAAAFAVIAAGVGELQGWPGLIFGAAASSRALMFAALALVARLCLVYPRFVRRAKDKNLLETLRAGRGSDALWVGAIWAVAGFLMSLGMNSLFFRVLYDTVFLFKSQRIPARAAMVAYVGLAVLAGVGATRVAAWAAARRRRVGASAVCAVVACALLFELRAAPLQFERGAVFPDAVTLRLKETPMRGGVVELPAGLDGQNHLYMLRAADHARPLVNATSSFIPPKTYEVVTLTREGTISRRLLDLFDELKVSYVVVHNATIQPERRNDYEAFLARAVAAGRLRFIRRFEGRDDLYAVTSLEPDAVSEESLPFESSLRGWEGLIAEDPVNILGEFREWSQTVYRMHKAAYGRMPRLEEFMPEVRAAARDVIAGEEGQESLLEKNLLALARTMSESAPFREAFAGKTDAEYVDALYANAGVAPPDAERASLVEGLERGVETRASVLRKVALNEEYTRKENYPSLVLLHYFGYFRRDPDAPPDKDMSGFRFWLHEVEASNDPARLTRGFGASYEYDDLKK